MSMLNSRDAHGYPLQGYDECGPYLPLLKEVVTKSNAKETQGNDTLTRLVQLLQAANAREDKLKEETELLNRKYNSLYREHMALKYEDFCESCQTKREITPPGKTITLCDECGEGKKTIHSLRLQLEKKQEEVRYWQDCYETLLGEHFEHDRRSHDGAQERV